MRPLRLGVPTRNGGRKTKAPTDRLKPAGLTAIDYQKVNSLLYQPPGPAAATTFYAAAGFKSTDRPAMYGLCAA